MRANSEKEVLFVNLVTAGVFVIRDDGTIMNTRTLKVYTRQDTNGQIQISVKVNGRARHMLAHRLIYLVLNGPLGPDDQVMHRDGVKSNNRPSNLEKTTNAANVQHAFDIGLVDRKKLSESMLRFYETNLAPNAKLSHPQVIEIRNRYAAGETRWALAQEFDMSWKDMAKLCAGTRYRAVKPAAIVTADR